MERVVLPAIIPTSYEDLVRAVALYDTNVPWVQIDLMDGVFVPTASWPYGSVDSPKSIVDSMQLPKTEELAYEVHLMVQDPVEIGSACIAAGAKRVIAHVESFFDGGNSDKWTVNSVERARECFAQWKKQGAQVGVSLLLETPLDAVYPLIESGDVSVVQVMSITPIGVQGSVFDERAVQRVRTLKERYPDLVIAVDGGVSKKTLPMLAQAGAVHFGVGSAIVKADDPLAAYAALVETLQQI